MQHLCNFGACVKAQMSGVGLLVALRSPHVLRRTRIRKTAPCMLRSNASLDVPHHDGMATAGVQVQSVGQERPRIFIH